MIKFICAVFLLSSLSGLAQDILPAENLVLSDSMIFMGIDFGLAKVVNPGMKDKAAEIKATNGPEWAAIAGTMAKNNNFKFDFRKKKVIFRTELFDKSYEKWDDNLVVDSGIAMTLQMLETHVKGYAPVMGCRLGLVFIIDKIDAVNKGLLTMYGVYVNLSDNSIIKVIRAEGGAEGPGFGKYWANGVSNAYTNLVNRNFDYMNRLKRHFKKERKDEKKPAGGTAK